MVYKLEVGMKQTHTHISNTKVMIVYKYASIHTCICNMYIYLLIHVPKHINLFSQNYAYVYKCKYVQGI